LCRNNPPAGALLRLPISRLTSQTGNWARQANQMSRIGFSVRYAAAPLHEVLELPGELILMQSAGGGFVLLHRDEQRWHRIGKDGLPLAEPVDPASDTYVEAVVLRMPLSKLNLEGISSLAALWPELRAAWLEIGLAGLLINAGQLLLPLFAMLVYDKVANNALFETLWALAAGMAIYVATDAGMRLIRSWTTERIANRLTLRSDETLWHRLLGQFGTPPGGFSNFLSNYRDLALSRDFVSSLYLLALADIPFLLLYLLVIGVIAWPLMLVAMLLAAAYAMAGLRMQARINDLARESEKRNTKKMTFMGDVLASLDLLRTAPGGNTFLRAWRDLTDRSAEADAGRRLASTHLGTLAAIGQTVTTVVMLVVGVYLISYRALSIGELIACNLLAGRAMALVASLFMVTGKWQDFQRAAVRMESSLEQPQLHEYTPRPDVAGHLLVTDLTKLYEGRPAALEKVSFRVVPGERIALLGRPGAGKTTLLRCLAGICDYDSGQILVDGLSLTHISRRDRTNWLAYKSQDPVVFAGSLEDNLLIATSGDRTRLAQAIWASGLEDEFSSGRMSLGMRLAERGGNLSGGQRQKVALARAFAQQCRFLLLDEPTAGLDPDSERMLAERIPDLLGSRTTLLMTTHSVIMLGLVRRVLALDKGRIIADGEREKLVRTA